MLSTSFMMPSADTLVSGTDFSLPCSTNVKVTIIDETSVIHASFLTHSCPQSRLNSAAFSNQNRHLRVVTLNVDVEFLNEVPKKQNVNKSIPILLHNTVNQQRTLLPAILHQFDRDEVSAP